MKKCLIAAALLILLSGCGAPEDFETMTDVSYDQPTVSAGQIRLALPEDAAVCVLDDPLEGTAYICDGYCITVSTVPGGDLDATLRYATGFGADQLQCMQRAEGENKRYDCVWAAAGEGSDQVGRAVVLDDGNFHYVLTVMANAVNSGANMPTLQAILDSFGVNIAP